MATRVPWYIQQRAESLAVAFLTKGRDVGVKREGGLDFGIDYRLELDADDASAWVGVQLHAVENGLPARLPWSRSGLVERFFGQVEVPLFLLAVNARDEGYAFAWVKEPVRNEAGATLVSHMDEGELPLTSLDYDGYRQLLAICRAYFKNHHHAGAA